VPLSIRERDDGHASTSALVRTGASYRASDAPRCPETWMPLLRRPPRSITPTATPPASRHARPANPAQAPAPIRAMLVGASVMPLAEGVNALCDDGKPLLADDAHGPRTVDLLVLGHDAPPDRVWPLASEAANAGIPVVRPGPRVTVASREVNPSGWQRDTLNEIGVYLARPERGGSWRAVTEIASQVDPARLVVLVPDGTETQAKVEGLTIRQVPAGDPRALGRALHRLRGIVDHPGMHATTADQAEWLVQLAARGVPVVTLGRGLAPGISEPLEHRLRQASLSDLDDADRREQLSLSLRRAARRHHASHHLWASLAEQAGLRWPRPPKVSVLLATNRPDQVVDAIRRIDRQSWTEMEIIVALHGEGFATEVPNRLRTLTRRNLEVLQVPETVPLGDLLNLATKAASGELIAKMDDDDLYDIDHLVDLVEALRYSDATIVGKGSEFVYLEELDLTIRRFTNGSESGNRNVAGGTLMIGRDALASAGGWQRARRAVDQRLIDDVFRAGGSLYRTHGHGFVLRRTAGGHTWNNPVDYFLQQAVAQWRGLAVDVAGVH
jgi:hypothetical protein